MCINLYFLRVLQQFFFVFIVIFFVLYYFFYNKNKISALRNLSGYLSGNVSKWSFFLPEFKGEYQGYKVSVVLAPKGENSPVYLNVALFKSSSFRLSIYRESILSNVGKKIGLVHEIKVNDEDFDSKFLIFSNRQSQAAAYLSNRKTKDIIKELFDKGFDTLSIDGKKILIRKPNYHLASDLNPENIKMIFQQMVFLTVGL